MLIVLSDTLQLFWTILIPSLLLFVGWYLLRQQQLRDPANHQQEQAKSLLPDRYLRYTGKDGIRQHLFPNPSNKYIATTRYIVSLLIGWNTTNNYFFNTKRVKLIATMDDHQNNLHRRSHSVDKNSDEGSYPGNDPNDPGRNNNAGKVLAPPVLVYHESARSIVFRDHLRRAVQEEDVPTGQDTKQQIKAVTTPTNTSATNIDHQHSHGNLGTTNSFNSIRNASHHSVQEIAKKILIPSVENEKSIKPSSSGIPAQQISGYTPTITPLQSLNLGPNDNFNELLHSIYDCTTPPTCQNDNVNGYSIADKNSNSSVIEDFTEGEKEVCEMLYQQRCCVKTIKNTDWTAFIDRFHYPHKRTSSCKLNLLHDDIPPASDANSDTTNYCYLNSYVTSTTMLPSNGRRMRAYGSTNQYTVGVIFALPRINDYDLYDYVGTADGADEHTIDTAYNIAEETMAMETETWSWPAGYSAKTEFNIDSFGKLINGRQEAIRSLTTLRRYNDDYCTKKEYMIANRLVSGLSQIPYNEVFLRVGGYGRLVHGKDVSIIDSPAIKRSFQRGVGLPVALFVRTAKFGDLITLLRTRARLINTIGENLIKGIPLLYVDPEIGVRVLTEKLQGQLWKIAARTLNPFQNTSIAHRTTVLHTDDAAFQQKVEELLELDESIQRMLTPEELARIAGGFGATDSSVASILQNVLKHDRQINRQNSKIIVKKDNVDDNFDDDTKPPPPITEIIEPSHRLQDVVNEGLTAAVRSGDYHTSRQLLILYSLVASKNDDGDDDGDVDNNDDLDDEANFQGGTVSKEGLEGTSNDLTHKKGIPDDKNSSRNAAEPRSSTFDARRNNESYKQMEQDMKLVQKKSSRENKLSTAYRLPAPPPPPPLDTDRLREATNSDGLLAVLGAAEVLKAMRTGSAQRRTLEAVSAVEEWVDYGEQSMAFRISSWYDQRAAQGDLQIATEANTNFMAFVSNKAILNRRLFAQQLHDAAMETDFTDVRFLQAVDAILRKMNSPCLRLELLQYILGLDNRYSVAHVKRSVELAATCLLMSQQSSSTEPPSTRSPSNHPPSPKLLTLGRKSSGTT